MSWIDALDTLREFSETPVIAALTGAVIGILGTGFFGLLRDSQSRRHEDSRRFSEQRVQACRDLFQGTAELVELARPESITSRESQDEILRSASRSARTARFQLELFGPDELAEAGEELERGAAAVYESRFLDVPPTPQNEAAFIEAVAIFTASRERYIRAVRHEAAG